MVESPSWRKRTVGAAGLSAGMDQPVSVGLPVWSTAKAIGVNVRLRDAGVASTFGDGWRGELPLALVEETAEGEVSQEERGEEREGEGFEEPARVDDLVRYFLMGVTHCLGGGVGAGFRHAAA